MSEENVGLESTVTIAGFPTVRLTRRELAERMVSDCLSARMDAARSPKLVFSSNGQGIALAGRSDQFSQVMKSADIIHADGMPVVFASRLTDSPLPERIATTDFFDDAAEAAASANLRFFFLGGTEASNKALLEAVSRRHPALDVAGGHHGYFSREDEAKICEIILESKPDVVWVGLGKPFQEFWSERNKGALSGVGWLKTCGGLFEFVTETSRRAPVWMQKAGLEWLYRARQDPKRLLWRYLTTNPYATFRIARHTPGLNLVRRIQKNSNT